MDHKFLLPFALHMILLSKVIHSSFSCNIIPMHLVVALPFQLLDFYVEKDVDGGFPLFSSSHNVILFKNGAPSHRCACCSARRAVVCHLPSAGGVAAVFSLRGDILLQQEVPEDPLETQRAQAGVRRAASASAGGGNVGSTGFRCSK